MLEILNEANKVTIKNSSKILSRLILVYISEETKALSLTRNVSDVLLENVLF